MGVRRRGGDGHNVLRRVLVVPTTGVLVYPDLFDSPRMVVEAKKSAARGYVREAIGHDLDYRNLLRVAGEVDVEAGILLPGRPDDDLVLLCGDLQIKVFVPDGDGFAALGGPHS